MIPAQRSRGSPEDGISAQGPSLTALLRKPTHGQRASTGSTCRAASGECSFKILESSDPWESLGSSHCKKQEQPALCREIDEGSSGRGPTGSDEDMHSCDLVPVCAASHMCLILPVGGGACGACWLESPHWTKSSYVRGCMNSLPFSPSSCDKAEVY